MVALSSRCSSGMAGLGVSSQRKESSGETKSSQELTGGPGNLEKESSEQKLKARSRTQKWVRGNVKGQTLGKEARDAKSAEGCGRRSGMSQVSCSWGQKRALLWATKRVNHSLLKWNELNLILCQNLNNSVRYFSLCNDAMFLGFTLCFSPTFLISLLNAFLFYVIFI